jgi:subfamily B ATP-binding cassette protein MsbA
MLKQFFSVMARYLRPYRKYLGWSVVLNFLSQWMNVFSFAVLIPILNILFKIDTQVYTYKPWSWDTLDKELIVNNAYAWVQELISIHGAFLTLVYMGLALVIMTGIKTLGYFA